VARAHDARARLRRLLYRLLGRGTLRNDVDAAGRAEGGLQLKWITAMRAEHEKPPKERSLWQYDEWGRVVPEFSVRR